MKLRFDINVLRSLLPLLPAAVLALVIGAELGWEQRDGVAATPAVTAPPIETVAVATLRPDFALPGPEERYSEISERPLFVPNRRPPPTLAVEAVKSTMLKGQFVLVGVIQGGGNDNIAILREVASGKNRRVKLGREINGLKLAKVEPKKVILTQGGDSEELSLKLVSPPQSQTQMAQPGATGTPGQQPYNPGSVRPPAMPIMPSGSGAAPPGLRPMPAMPGQPVTAPGIPRPPAEGQPH
jgi:general secretion pathway protein N